MSVKKFSIVSTCMNRSAMLRVSLQSWIGNPLISEIVIIDWCSKEPISWAEALDPRIRVIRVEGQKYFHLGKAFNTGISNSSGDFVMKMDVDYILNPYCNLVEEFQKIITENVFIVGGGWIGEGKGNPFLQPTNGFLCAPRKSLLEAGGYNESLQGWGYDDDDIINKLLKLGLTHKILRLSGGAFIYHNPHGAEWRVENYDNKDPGDSWKKNKAISEGSSNI